MQEQQESPEQRVAQFNAYFSRARGWLGRQSRTAHIALVGAAVIVFALGCGLGSLVGTSAQSAGSGSTPPPAQTHVTQTASGSWVAVEHFTGDQNQQTPMLTFPSGARIVWSVQPGPTVSGNFLLEADFADGTISQIANAITPPAQHSVYNLQRISGSIAGYLHIESDGNPYDITLEVLR